MGRIGMADAHVRQRIILYAIRIIDESFGRTVSFVLESIFVTLVVGLLPALVLFGGALLWLVLRLPVFHRWLPLATCALSAVALVYSTGASSPVTLFPPNEALPALTLTVYWNSAARVFGMFLLLILIGRFLQGIDDDPPSFVFGALVTAGSALLFFASDNFTTLASAWVFVELGLLCIPADDDGSRESAARAFGWNLVAIVLVLTAGMIVANQAGSLRLSDVVLEGITAFLILVAIWIRSGIYPLQAAAPANLNSLGIRVGLPLLLGGYLMTRLIMQLEGAFAFEAELKILAIAAVGASALVVVGQVHGGIALTWVLRALGAMILLIPLFVADTGVASALCVWFALGAFAVCAFVELAVHWRAEPPRVRLTLIVWIIALVMVTALPFSPIFWTRVGLLGIAYSQVGVALWLLLIATTALVTIPVWREVLASNQVAPRAPTRFDYAALALVLLPSLALTFAPFVFLAPFGAQVERGGRFSLDVLFAPSNTATLIFVIAGLIVPPVVSFELARRWKPRTNLLPTVITNVLDLSNLARVLDALYRFLRALVQQSLALLEQPPIAWLLFLVIWVAVWVIGLSS